MRGVFPVNFDNEKHSVPPERIWPTRAALLSTCLMAVIAYNEKLLDTADVLKLDVYAQKLIIQMYEEMNSNDPIIQEIKTLAKGNMKEFLCLNSEGNYEIFLLSQDSC